MEKPMSIEGKLSKYTNVMKGYQSRYFILNAQNGNLEYHISQSEVVHAKPRGSLALEGAVIAPSTEDSYTFTVNAANGEVYKLRASNAKQRQEWVAKLRLVSDFFTTQIAHEHPPLRDSSNGWKRRTGSVVSNINSNLTKLKDQVHHQLTQPPSASHHVTTSSEKLSSGGTGERRRAGSGSSLHRKVVTNISTTLHPSDATELMQARETIVSADNYLAGLSTLIGLLQFPPRDSDVTAMVGDGEELVSAVDKDLLMIKCTSKAVVDSLATCYTTLHRHKQQLDSSNFLPSGAEVSWLPWKGGKRNSTVTTSDSSVDTVEKFHYNPPDLADPSDEVEEEFGDKDDDLGPVDEHKNVIMHLLSQLKLGMDLTKVTLPTFILEKRSLLEMYADFTSSADMFLSTTEGYSPVDRMHRVLKYYITSFHCGRRGQIAKKPYNPIVGEIFQCSFHVKSPCGNDQRIRFIAEQVSHHPPISALHVSCKQRQVSMTTHIWTKSKFMNMSIGVVNIGQGKLRLEEHDEEYVITYPSAYARSVLTVPWSEMGGRCTITCEKTRLQAVVVFHTKPVYGGEPHKVTAEVKETSTGFISCKAHGRWNGELNFSYYQRDSTAESTEVIDTSQLKVFRKWIRPIDRQSNLESRKLWWEVTKSLRSGDMTRATEFKSELETRQRESERRRQESNLEVQTVYFAQSKPDNKQEYNYVFTGPSDSS